jgi:hypothetical protein
VIGAVRPRLLDAAWWRRLYETEARRRAAAASAAARAGQGRAVLAGLRRVGRWDEPSDVRAVDGVVRERVFVFTEMIRPATRHHHVIRTDLNASRRTGTHPNTGRIDDPKNAD